MNLSEIYLSPFHSECFKIHQSSVLVLIASLCFSGFNYFFNGHVSLYILNCFIWGSQNFLGLNFGNIGECCGLFVIKWGSGVWLFGTLYALGMNAVPYMSLQSFSWSQLGLLLVVCLSEHLGMEHFIWVLILICK